MEHRIELTLSDGRLSGDFLIWRQGSGPTVEIFEIEIRPISRRRGHGRKLIDLLLDKHLPPGTTTVYAITRSTNRIAQHFYESLRFRPIPLYDFYKDEIPQRHCDALMYVRDVGSQA